MVGPKMFIANNFQDDVGAPSLGVTFEQQKSA